MRNNYFINLLLFASFITSGCERAGFSPLEIKIDDSYEAQTASATLAPQGSDDVYTVSGNETLFDVANKYNVDPMNLARINGISHSHKLKQGDVLRLPRDSQEPMALEGIAAPADLAENGSSRASSKNNEEKKRQERINEEFAGLMAYGGKSASSASSSKNNKNASTVVGASSNKQENILSSPKITKTASGLSTDKAEKAKETGASEIQNSLRSGTVAYPVRGKIISQFGDVKDGIANDGINIKSSAGTPVKASADGVVLYAGNELEKEFGNVVILQHNNDLITSYAHLGKIAVKKNAKLKVGDVLGTVGSTGDVTEPQLHFEIMKDKIAVNPMKYLLKDAKVRR
ncbi:MAG: LysM peptidoglycan-binding domain-containing M23 family metallopeptidase [Holosporaceae bacterium]|jgi:murein DD-endopeptidase MepM/ murein hydrolase activator NlpD|nr:LysM peptidoglycan-binding domain-containing M23 family metallopeptidase [Holosporaceae bacterium]